MEQGILCKKIEVNESIAGTSKYLLNNSNGTKEQQVRTIDEQFKRTRKLVDSWPKWKKEYFFNSSTQ